MKTRPRFLVLRGGAIGDFIFTLPALAALREAWPHAEIELVGYPHIAQLAALGGLVDRVASLDRARIARLYAAGRAADPELTAYIRAFDLVVSYLHDPLETVGENLRATGVAQVLSASPVAPPEHAADHLARPLESLAIYAAGRTPALSLPPADRVDGAARLRALGLDPARTVVLHPGSGSPRKNWPLAGYRALAGRLTARGLQPLFTLGEADTAEASALQDARGGPPRVEGLDLCTLAGVLDAAAAFVGNDSGITHLAAAIGRPCLALFGPTDPAIWGPRGARTAVLRAPRGRLDDLDADAVEAAFADRAADLLSP